MSSPSEHSPERSVSVSSLVAGDSTMEDTASSILAEGAPPGVTVQWLTNTPNSAFAQRMQAVHMRSISPRPQWTVSPSRLSIAQQRAQAAEEKAESAVSGVGVVADQTRYMRSVAEAAIAEARSVRDEVTSRIAEVAQCSDVSASNVTEVLTGKVQQVAAQFEAHTLHAVGQVAQQLEQEVRAVATGTAAMQEQSTRTAIETKTAIEQMSTRLAQLATQMAELQSTQNADVPMGEISSRRTLMFVCRHNPKELTL